MSSLDYMRGEKIIIKDRVRKMAYKSLEDLELGAEVHSIKSRNYWKRFKENLKNEI